MSLRYMPIQRLIFLSKRLTNGDVNACRISRICSLRQHARTVCFSTGSLNNQYTVQKRHYNLQPNYKPQLLSSHGHLTLTRNATSGVKWDSLTMTNPNVTEYLQALETKNQQALDIMLSSTSDSERSEANKAIQETRVVVQPYKRYKTLASERNELLEIINGEEDKEMVEMAKQEVTQIEEDMKDTEDDIFDKLVPPLRTDHNDVLLEVTAGVGGVEAMLFAEEMYDMYMTFAEYMGWACETVQHDENEAGGLRHATLLVSGQDVYRWLKFEGGVHRVQRVPSTEKSGRMHTSTSTVSIAPQPTEIDIQIEKKDLRVDVFRAGGAGGQHVNKTESAVRITHLPTGTVVECQQGRSQIKNKETAMKVLRSRLYEKELEQQQSHFKSQKKIQIGTAARSEKIRTYNYNQDRITDHRLSGSRFNIEDFISGREALSDLLVDLLKEMHAERIFETLEQFKENQDKFQ